MNQNQNQQIAPPEFLGEEPPTAAIVGAWQTADHKPPADWPGNPSRTVEVDPTMFGSLASGSKPKTTQETSYAGSGYGHRPDATLGEIDYPSVTKPTGRH